ncbi:oligosaccharide flippase family protein [Clostridium sp. JS66]|uniref:oligosaccharide flippase family protein n=1 Tax=Clostridium sp. JS66 TaxID=3064705 RepID=UPI00298DB9B4|nr:oligosaccharide flippase family protein [Clostridium sp. JS66]WPC43289.1 oligosaccharide flippase family protein [Clostridium sp. JS66]
MEKKVKRLIQHELIFENPIAKKLIGGMAWNIIGTVFSKVFLMIASVITARMLGVDKNGEFGVINSTVLMFSTFAGLGLGTTATRFVAEYRNTDKMKCGRIIGMTNLIGIISGIIMAMALVILAPWLAIQQLNAPHLASGLMLASIMLITNTVNTIQISTLSGFEYFKSIAKLSIIQGLMSFPIYVVFTYFLGVNGLIIGYIIIGCIMLILYEFENNKIRKMYGIYMDIKNAHKELYIMWKFSLPSMLSNVMVGPVTWIGNTFITSSVNGYFQIGIFNAANQWRSVLTFLPTAVGSVILPLIVANKGNERLEKINILFGWIMVICFAIPILTAPELISWLYGREFNGFQLNVSLLIVVLTCCILSYKEGIARNLVSNNLMWWAFMSNALWGITFLGILWHIRVLGAIGIAIAYLISYFITTVVFIPFYIRRGVVHHSLLISKEIIFMWLALLIQTIVTAITRNIVIRVLALLFSIYALWLIGKMMTKKTKLS